MQRYSHSKIFYGYPLPDMTYNDVEAAKAECQDLAYMSLDELMAERRYLIDAKNKRKHDIDAGKPVQHDHVIVMGEAIPEPVDAVRWMENRLKKINDLIKRQRGSDRGR